MPNMNEFLKMDIFFFITSVAVIAFTLCALYVLMQFSRILKHVEHIVEQVADESDVVRADLALLRADIKRGKGIVKSLFSLFGKRVKSQRNKK